MKERQSSEFRDVWQELIRFFNANRSVFWISVFAAVFSCGQMLADFRIGVDSEANMNSPDYIMESWYTVNRFSLVWLKSLFGMREFNPFAENFFMLTGLVLCGVMGSFLFYECAGCSQRIRGFCRIFPLLFLSHPCLVQQFAFTLQAAEVAMCMLTVLISVFCVMRWAFGDRKGWLLAGFVFMVFGFGGYQALVPFYMAAALAGYIIYYQFHDGMERFYYLRAALRHAVAFVFGYVLYVLAGKAVTLWQFGPDFQVGYLEEQIAWKTRPVWECIGMIKSYIKEVALGSGPYYGPVFLIGSLIVLLYLLWGWFSGKRREYVLCMAAAAALVLSPFYLCFYQGSGILMRSQLCLPFVSAFVGSAVLLVSQQPAEDRVMPLRMGLVRAGSAAAVFFLVLAGIRQGSISSRAAFIAQLTYENDREVASQIVSQMHSMGASDAGMHIAMVGCLDSFQSDEELRREIIGYSIFEWDFLGPVGVTRRGIGFMQAHGYPYEAATEEEYAAALETSKDMPSWPSDGAVRFSDGVVIVKFSE